MTHNADQLNIHTINDYRRIVRNGPYAWPGGYPLFFVTADSACLCWQCGAKKERRNVLEAINDKRWGNQSGWRINTIAVNWEDDELYCDNCSEPIESAYADSNSDK